MSLTQEQFENILKLEKFFDSVVNLPKQNETKSYSLNDKEKNYYFELNVERKNTISINKVKLHHSCSKVGLVRLELDAPPHVNPDGTKTGRNHIHIYREGWDRLAWAYDIDSFSDKLFQNFSNFNLVFDDFCKYCNIIWNFNTQVVI